MSFCEASPFWVVQKSKINRKTTFLRDKYQEHLLSIKLKFGPHPFLLFLTPPSTFFSLGGAGERWPPCKNKNPVPGPGPGPVQAVRGCAARSLLRGAKPRTARRETNREPRAAREMEMRRVRRVGFVFWARVAMGAKNKWYLPEGPAAGCSA